MPLHTGTPEKAPEAGKRESEHRPSPSHSTPSRSPGEAAVRARARALLPAVEGEAATDAGAHACARVRCTQLPR